MNPQQRLPRIFWPRRTPRFPRSLLVKFEEPLLVLSWFNNQDQTQRTMLDVGAHYGGTSKPFAFESWDVHVFEPDPENRKRLNKSLADYHNVTIDPRAVCEVDGEEVQLFSSEESSGISTLAKFVESHKPTSIVKTVRLDTYVSENNIGFVDFLKIDTEGFDLMVLKGFPWTSTSPEVILCEFEDRKTKNLGYGTIEMIDFLQRRGYTILISEWHPIIRYGITHSFSRLYLFRGKAPDSDSWGNLIAVRNKKAAQWFVENSPQFITRRNTEKTSSLATNRFENWKSRRSSTS
jgi:FkbM family methyltransferase